MLKAYGNKDVASGKEFWFSSSTPNVDLAMGIVSTNEVTLSKARTSWILICTMIDTKHLISPCCNPLLIYNPDCRFLLEIGMQIHDDEFKSAWMVALEDSLNCGEFPEQGPLWW